MAGIGGQAVKSVGKAMFPRNSYSILRHAQCSVLRKTMKYSTDVHETASDRDPAPFFFNDQVQDILKTLTRPDPSKIFRRQKDGSKIKDPEYKFMTDEQLATARWQAEERGMRRLQMPPVVKERTEIDEVVAKDPEIQGYSESTYVFTDITYGLNNYERLMVVRQPDGVLRKAKWAERQRLNQIYFPLKGREFVVPRMFQDEYLKDLLRRKEYEFILNRACLQFDPNDPDYHRVTKMVYETVNNENHFDMLRSTRHYGPLAFHLAWTKNIDNLLHENITTDRLEDAALLIKLYHRINPTAKSAGIEHDGDDMKLIESYKDLDSPMRGKLELALRAMRELIKAREIVAEGVKKAHGL